MCNRAGQPAARSAVEAMPTLSQSVSQSVMACACTLPMHGRRQAAQLKAYAACCGQPGRGWVPACAMAVGTRGPANAIMPVGHTLYSKGMPCATDTVQKPREVLGECGVCDLTA